MYILADINESVENQDLYRNKDDFCNIFKTKIIIFLISKILYIISISVKCIRCRIYGF